MKMADSGATGTYSYPRTASIVTEPDPVPELVYGVVKLYLVTRPRSGLLSDVWTVKYEIDQSSFFSKTGSCEVSFDNSYCTESNEEVGWYLTCYSSEGRIFNPKPDIKLTMTESMSRSRLCDTQALYCKDNRLNVIPVPTGTCLASALASTIGVNPNLDTFGTVIGVKNALLGRDKVAFCSTLEIVNLMVPDRQDTVVIGDVEMTAYRKLSKLTTAERKALYVTIMSVDQWSSISEVHEILLRKGIV